MLRGTLTENFPLASMSASATSLRSPVARSWEILIFAAAARVPWPPSPRDRIPAPWSVTAPLTTPSSSVEGALGETEGAVGLTGELGADGSTSLGGAPTGMLAVASTAGAAADADALTSVAPSAPGAPGVGVVAPPAAPFSEGLPPVVEGPFGSDEHADMADAPSTSASTLHPE